MGVKLKKPSNKKVARVPVIMQMEALECGAASLAMLSAYYGKWIPLEQVRRDCGVSRDGSNALNILKAARSYGFTAGGYKYEPEELKKEGQFPCIVHWEFNHFIVVNGFKGGRVYINDPARGSISITEQEFDKGFTGIVLSLIPGDGFEPSGKKKSMLSFARKRLTGAGPAVAFVVLITVIISLADIVNVGFSRMFMDQLLTGYDRGYLIPFIIAFGILVLVQIGLTLMQAIYSLRISGKFAAVGSSTFFWHVLSLPMEFFSQRLAGDILLRQQTNTMIAQSMVNIISPIFMNLAMTVFYLVVMLRYSMPLTAIGILGIFINMLTSRLVSKKRVNLSRVILRDQGKLASATVSGVEMIETIKSSGAENGFFRKWAGYQASLNRANVSFEKIDAALVTILGIVNATVNNIVMITGVYLVIKGSFTVGMVFAFQGFLTSFMAPAGSMIMAAQTMTQLRTQMERIEDVMEYKSDRVFSRGPDNKEPDPEAGKLSGHIQMKNVTFGYSALASPVISDFNMDLAPGRSVAFVGASGCGKSTLSKLISGLYAPWEGEILIDGMPIDSIDRSVFTGSVAVVDQDVILFEDTIANNVKMWDNSIEDFELIMACRDAKIHEEVMKREGGYSYRLLEGGKDFSGGERQRLEIARVLAQDPTIIILDEATSALDAQTEYEVVRSIKDRGITCVVIAHRLSTVRDCDEIIVMDKGVVVERGTHDELMALSGHYCELVNSD